MPKRFQRYNRVPTAAQTESFDPYRTAILIIVVSTFALFGVQSVGMAVHANGAEEVASCFADSTLPAYHRFISCTEVSS